ncbi:phage holin family protein [Neisseria perflava]|uniref:phage holin family protein n=1 Tax=Neisseria perflava TaxID=33053 RepID=UPI00209E5015|nr:phage holin family protein [Neisseria perflava]MCP1661200.1 putative membrane protein YqjE [Neisseria perflava]MCP1771689.1 putative membrane protein YqjE [Neisseria perflava]
MSIRQNIEHAKVLFNQGIDLLLLRLQVLNLDLAEQAGNAFRMAVWLVLAAVMLLVGLFSLLLGLDRILDDKLTPWVFFGISLFCLLIIALVFRLVSCSWRKQNNQIAATLRDMQTDIAYLRGEFDGKDKGRNHE